MISKYCTLQLDLALTTAPKVKNLLVVSKKANSCRKTYLLSATVDDRYGRVLNIDRSSEHAITLRVNFDLTFNPARVSCDLQISAASLV